MENDTLKKEADKVINVTYMLSGVLEQSFQEMDEILDRLHKRLHHEDRRLINSIRKHIRFLNSNIESLRTHSLSKMDEETVECFDDTTLRFYVIFMKLLEVAGIDYLCDLRIYDYTQYITCWINTNLLLVILNWILGLRLLSYKLREISRVVSILQKT